MDKTPTFGCSVHVRVNGEYVLQSQSEFEAPELVHFRKTGKWPAEPRTVTQNGHTFTYLGAQNG